MDKQIKYKNKRKHVTGAITVALAAVVLLNGTTFRSDAYPMTVQMTADKFTEISHGTGRNADVVSDGRLSERKIGVTVDGIQYSGQAFLYMDTTYVGFREFSVFLAGAEVSWDSDTSTAIARTSSTTVTAGKNQEYMVANGRYLWVKYGVIIKDGTTYVPIRALATAFGATLEWNGKNYIVSVTRGSGTIKNGSSFYKSDEVYWLSKIIHAESRGEPLTGKIAVGNVVLNRVRSDNYPNTIYGVIFDRKYGVQFSPVIDGSIYLEPGEEAIIAAKLCLEGYTVSPTILFFINRRLAENFWVTTRPLEVSIGNHDFYA